MKTLITLAISLTALSIALPLPALANSVGSVPYCASNAGSDHDTKAILMTELLVKNLTVLALDDWNGCLKAITVDSAGKTTIAYYDENLSVIRQDS